MGSIGKTMLAGTFVAGFATFVAAEEAARAPLPLKFTIDDTIRAEVEGMMTRSATLRRQVAIISAAPARVHVRASMAPLGAFRRAEASIDRFQSGYIRATLFVPPGMDFAELLAHELEHVVEQIERVDLAALARTGAAWRDAGGTYETARAREAGRAAALEVDGRLR